MKSSPEKKQGSLPNDKKKALLAFGAFRTIVKSSSKENLAKGTSRSAVSFDHEAPQLSPRANGSENRASKSPDISIVNNRALEKKKELQRNLQEQFITSNSTQRSFTNALSQRIAEKKRPNLKVEDILTKKGRETKDKIKKLEQDLYGKMKSPSITKKAKTLNKDDNVYQRLYEMEKERNSQDKASRRETMDSKIPKSGSSPKFMMHNASQRSLSGDSKLKTSNSPLKASLTEILAKAANNKSLLSPSKFDISTIANSPNPKYGLSSPNSTSARFLKPKTHNEEKVHKPESARDFTYIPLKKGKESEPKIEEKPSESLVNHSFSQDTNNPIPKRSSTGAYKTLSGFNSADTSKAVLPNMLYFKNSDKSKIVRADKAFADSALDIREKSLGNHEEKIEDKTKGKEKKKQNDLQKFYSQIAYLDFKQNNPYDSPRTTKGSDIGQRTQEFLNKKNEKIQNKRVNNLSKELSECTFQPQLNTLRSVKSASKISDNNIFEQIRRVSGDIVSPSRNYIKGKPRTVENSAAKEQNPPARLNPNKEGENVQKKLYDSILNK